MKKTIFAAFILCSFVLFGQTKKVLFLGNSYTYYNNMPQMVSDLATSKGKTLVFDANTPGGQRLMNHAVNTTSLTKIASDDWDYVVLQGQSQEVAFPDSQLDTEVYPYAEILNDSVKSNNACSETMFFMTWGRENGDQSNCAFFPPLCTYDGMQSRLKYGYMNMADQNEGSTAPVGEAWRYIRNNYPAIDLYSPDESHPSLEGSYLAACVFYVSIFRESISGSTFDPGLPAGQAQIIQDVASMTVLDSLDQWNIGAYDAVADFSYFGSATTVNFVNSSENGTDYFWDFGDMNTSTASDPIHTYPSVGTYNVTLIADNGCTTDTLYQNVDLNTLEIEEWDSETRLWNNANEILIFGNQSFDLYEIYSMNGARIQSNKILSNSIKIENLQKGIYILKLHEDQKIISLRFMK